MALEAGLQAAAAIAGSGALAQIVGRRLPIPVPVFLLAAGVLLGRDGLHIVEPDELGDLIRIAVALAVAVIVFEGGTLISWPVVRQLGPVVRNLVVGGLIVTPLVGAVATHYLLDFPWRVAALFGALVSVTGPSVITPLLRSVRVNDRLRAILMGEGVIIDPFGALLTLFLLQVAVAESLDPTAPTAWVISRVLTGLAVGAAGAAFVFLFPRLVRRMSSREVSLLVVGSAVTAFAVAESIGHESGLTAMVVMGIALGNLPLPHKEAMHDFQESVVAFLVATVYVLLAASVDLGAVVDLWPEGFIAVAVLALVGRPLLVFLASWGSDLSWRERAFLSAVAPRGVVAASLASVVALEIGASLGANSEQFVAMVFAVIALTIGVQSAYAGPVARLLRVTPVVTVIAGAGEVGRRVAARLQAAGEPVLIIESDEEAAVRAREEGFEVRIGDVSKLEVLKAAGVGEAKAFIITTASDERNLLAAQHARTLGCRTILARVNDPQNVPAFQDLGVVVVSPQEAVAAELVSFASTSALSDILAPVDEDVVVRRVWLTNPQAQRPIESLKELRGTVVIMVRRGRESVIPTGKTELRLGDLVTLIGHRADVERAERALTLEAAEVDAS